MIVILYQEGCDGTANELASDLSRAFPGTTAAQLISADSATSWPAADAWDDLLVVLFNSGAYPAAGAQFITYYINERRDSALLLPIALSPSFPVPPSPAVDIKALQFDADSSGVEGRMVRRIGGMLGLRLQGRDAKIFLSHRASDGAAIAAQLERHMRSIGYRPWLDQARDIDGDTKILPGTPAQQEIDAALADASLVLLLDTPDAPASRWIKHEIDTADGRLLPILPVCFRAPGDKRIGPRFPSLLNLQRWVDIPLPAAGTADPLPPEHLDAIVQAAERYLCEILQRKCRVPYVVQDHFTTAGFSWDVLDKHRLLFRSSKSRGPRFKTEVLHHCSIFDQIYEPALNCFCKFLQEAATWAHYSLFIYDGDVLPELMLAELTDARPEDRVIILHHQELAALIRSNFTCLGKL